MSNFTDIVDKVTKENGTYAFQKIRLYDRGDDQVVLIVENMTAPVGIKFEMVAELTEGEAVALAGALLSAVEKKKKKVAA